MKKFDHEYLVALSLVIITVLCLFLSILMAIIGKELWAIFFLCGFVTSALTILCMIALGSSK